MTGKRVVTTDNVKRILWIAHGAIYECDDIVKNIEIAMDDIEQIVASLDDATVINTTE